MTNKLERKRTDIEVWLRSEQLSAIRIFETWASSHGVNDESMSLPKSLSRKVTSELSSPRNGKHEKGAYTISLPADIAERIDDLDRFCTRTGYHVDLNTLVQKLTDEWISKHWILLEQQLKTSIPEQLEQLEQLEQYVTRLGCRKHNKIPRVRPDNPMVSIDKRGCMVIRKRDSTL